MVASFTLAAFSERIEVLRHHMVILIPLQVIVVKYELNSSLQSNPAGSGLLDAARTLLPIAPRRVPSNVEPSFQQRMQATQLKHDEPLAVTSHQIKVSIPQEDSSGTVEGPAIDFPSMKNQMEHLAAGTSLLLQP